MSKAERNGKRKRRPFKEKETRPGRFLKVTDTSKTETQYFRGLHRALSQDGQNSVTITVVDNVPENRLIDKCRELSADQANYAQVWIVLDRDEVQDFDEFVQKAEAAQISVAWSTLVLKFGWAPILTG